MEIKTVSEIDTASDSLQKAGIIQAYDGSRCLFPGRPTCAVADAYRPISLTSILIKITERLLDEPLTKKPLEAKPHAYVVGKSVHSAIHNIYGKSKKH